MPPRARTVLLVDDSEKIRHLLCGLFESAGFQVCAEAADGAEAIQQAGKYKPDLIVLDLSMPGINGFEAGRVLRRALPATPIILFTMYADSIAVNDAHTAGITSVVPKSNVEKLMSEAEAQLNPRKLSANS